MKRITLTLLVFIVTTVASIAQTRQELYIQSGKQTIYGILNSPDATFAGKRPLVIISHGFNGTHSHGQNYFETFNRLGYKCYTFDFPSGSVHSCTDNNTVNMSIIDE